jgi:hypothetical protein
MKLKAKVLAEWQQWEHKWAFTVWPDYTDPASLGKMLLADVEVEIPDPSNITLQNGMVEAYREEQKRVRADAEEKVTQLQARIDEMLCIEDHSEQAR